ncbi:MAG: hypothetical protein LBD94_02425 [Rickettsiales bacterium]|jgi:fatty acyl-ACP thioesterase B|nr:hypothetical protein [Rickettsiales bacterium]
MAEKSQFNDSDNSGFLHRLPIVFATAKNDVAVMAGHLAQNARHMLTRLRRLSKRAASAKTTKQFVQIKLKTEKYIQKKKLETSETGKNGLLRPVSMMNELQAIADIHATLLGAGRSYCMKNNITWVVTHYLVDILEMPNDKEELELSTWPANHEALRAVRDFEVRGADGRLMLRATSQWIMIDLATRRPVKISEYLPNWDCVPARALDEAFDKFAEFDSEYSVDFDVRYDDIDVNPHVNNSVYATWATESLGYDFLNSHKLRRLKINFKKEIPAGTKKVSVGFQIDGNLTRHVIKTDRLTNAIVVCEWL